VNFDDSVSTLDLKPMLFWKQKGAGTHILRFIHIGCVAVRCAATTTPKRHVDISIGSDVFAQFTVITSTQTETAR